jgi:uncharacterized protein YggE
MKTRSLLWLLIFALVTTACAPATAATDKAQPRTISVNGTGQAVLTPDIAYITIGVQSEAPSAKEAVAKNNAQAQAVINALLGIGVAETDIRTTNFSIYPNQRYDRDGNPLEITYVVNNSVYVTIRELEQIGDILDQVVQAGANQINNIQFDVADKTAALAAARDAAVAQAREQAEALAKAAGVSIDQVQSIAFYNAAPVTAKADTRLMMAEAASAVPIQSGQMTLTVNVQMGFTIK